LVGDSQGDQIGRIFAYWRLFTFRSYLKIKKVEKNNWPAAFQSKSCVSILTKMGWMMYIHYGLLFQKLIWSPW
jgi:hypothetical protein